MGVKYYKNKKLMNPLLAMYPIWSVVLPKLKKSINLFRNNLKKSPKLGLNNPVNILKSTMIERLVKTVLKMDIKPRKNVIFIEKN